MADASRIVMKAVTTKTVTRDIMNLGDLRQLVADCEGMNATVPVDLSDRLTLTVESVTSI